MRRLWIVVADRAQAMFYERLQTGHLREAACLRDAAAHGHERDFSSDRPGRTHAPMGRGARHAFGPEPHARRDEAARFARIIAGELEDSRQRDGWDDLVLIAAEPFLGLLRRELAPPTAERVVHVVAKDFVHQPIADLERRLGNALGHIEAA
jgi:protein required for attachment to host cells